MGLKHIFIITEIIEIRMHVEDSDYIAMKKNQQCDFETKLILKLYCYISYILEIITILFILNAF